MKLIAWPNVITREEQLFSLYEKLDNSGQFALDLEFIPEKTFQPVLALIQIATAAEVYIIDPLTKINLQDLWHRVADERFNKVLHAGREDLNIIFQLSDLIPKNIFDTQLAAGFIGFGYPTGYKNLLSQVLNIHINKSESFSDWLARPLSTEQLQYAREDVCHLLPLAEKIVAMLKHENRLTWAIEECANVFSENSFKQKSYSFTKIKGAHTLPRQKLAVLQALCDLRAQEAKSSNKPLKSILSDLTLLELSKWNASDLSALEKLRGINYDQVRRLQKKIIVTIQEALAENSASWPTWPQSERISETENLVGDLLYFVLKTTAFYEKIAPELLATRSEVQKLITQFKSNCHVESNLPVLQDWRRELIGETLLNILNGNSLIMNLESAGNTPIKISVTEKL